MTILLTNAWVLTLDAAFTEYNPGWVQIDGTTITALGAGAPPVIEQADIIDCGGDIVMPGMVNTHCHMGMSVFRGLAEDVDDRLYRYILPLERKFVTPDMVRVGSALSALEMIEGGVTTVAEAGLRAIVGQTLADFNAPDHADFDAGFARVEALVDAFAGHALITPSIAPHAPYSTGLAVMTRIAQWSDEHRQVPVQIHLAESQLEVDWALKEHQSSSVAVVHQSGLLKAGLIAAHCLHLSEADIGMMAAAGVGVATNPRSNGKAGRGIARIEAMRAAGLPVGMGSDGAMSGNTLDLFAQFAPVSMFAKLLAGSRKPLPARTVIAMATIEGASVLGLDHVTGSLEPGKQADLIAINLTASRLQPIYDPYSMLVFAAGPTDVRDVMVAGRWLKRSGQVTTLEPKKILRDAMQIAREFKAEMLRLDGEPA